jgi:hypothetical protein
MLNYQHPLPEKARKKYITRATMYTISFFITWIGPTWSRVTSIVSPSQLNFSILLMHAVTSPLMGFLNAQVFFCIYYASNFSESTSDEDGESVERDHTGLVKSSRVFSTLLVTKDTSLRNNQDYPGVSLERQFRSPPVSSLRSKATMSVSEGDIYSGMSDTLIASTSANYGTLP